MRITATIKKRTVHIVPAVLSFGWSLFIWSNSLKNAAESSTDSGRIVEIINNTLEQIGADVTITQHFARKAAHFSEFAFLGILLALAALPLICRFRRHFSVLISLATACADELLQLASPGRSCQLTDVIIDFSGALCGMAFVFALNILVRRLRTKSRRR